MRALLWKKMRLIQFWTLIVVLSARRASINSVFQVKTPQITKLYNHTQNACPMKPSAASGTLNFLTNFRYTKSLPSHFQTIPSVSTAFTQNPWPLPQTPLFRPFLGTSLMSKLEARQTLKLQFCQIRTEDTSITRGNWTILTIFLRRGENSILKCLEGETGITLWS